MPAPTVLIVGAGPTGLVMALHLARHERPFCIIDRNRGIKVLWGVELTGFDGRGEKVSSDQPGESPTPALRCQRPAQHHP